MTLLDIDDVFNGDAPCILYYIREAFGGSFGEPEYMIIVVKKGYASTSDGWVRRYDQKMKAAIINDIQEDESPNAPEQAAKGKPEGGEMLLTHIKNADDLITDFEEAEFNDISTSVWDESCRVESLSEWRGFHDAKDMRNTFAISEDDREDRAKEM